MPTVGIKYSSTFENSSPIEGTLAYDLTIDNVYYSKRSFVDAIPVSPETFTIKDHTFRILKKEYKKAGSYYYEILLEGTYPLLKRVVC